MIAFSNQIIPPMYWWPWWDSTIFTSFCKPTYHVIVYRVSAETSKILLETMKLTFNCIKICLLIFLCRLRISKSGTNKFSSSLTIAQKCVIEMINFSLEKNKALNTFDIFTSWNSWLPYSTFYSVERTVNPQWTILSLKSRDPHAHPFCNYDLSYRGKCMEEQPSGNDSWHCFLTEKSCLSLWFTA